MHDDVILSMRNITKEFPGVLALDNVDFTLRKGQIHALMGENGAGKSTLIKVLTGVYTKDSGQVFMAGHDKEVTIRTPQDALNLGINTVYQEINLCPNLTVAENLFIGRDERTFVSWRSREKKARELLERLSIPATPNQQLSSCSIAVQQMVAVARAVAMDCKVLVLDEPTSSLDAVEVAQLFELMRNLQSRGVGIVFITHFLEQVYEVCDTITVLRDGKLVGEYPIDELPQVELVSKMLSKELSNLSELQSRKASTDDAELVYEATHLASAATNRPFDFAIRRGEVNGFAGLLGSGRSESVRAIFGADDVLSGTINIGGEPVKITKPLDAMKHGIAYLSEDRKGDGVIGELSVRDNIILALQTMRGFFKPFTKAEAEAFADEYIEKLGIKTPSSDVPVNTLSGGNQQKVILARWLLTHPEYLILDEPTRGIDIGTKVEIQRLVTELAREGVSVTFISSEIEEMLRTCSRIIVMKDRNIVGELSDEDVTQENIMQLIVGEEIR
jgi:simple sugar transport system ATP-binding protein